MKGLTTLEGGRYLKTILHSLRTIGIPDAVARGELDSSGNPVVGAYDIYHNVLNTREHGVPQNRTRWYCVGIRKGCLRDSGKKSFEFPAPIPCPPIDQFLDPNDQFASAGSSQTGQLAKSNIEKASKLIRDSGGHPDQRPYIVD